ncbi:MULTISPECIES: ABC transporter permease [Agrobacterium]|uniref:ABC transporter permease n=1 Tax=Agrobacterium rubi TaxID=28099 RepID=A0AAE7R7U2_9HYPH|nr:MULTISPECIES: ABC transporter permease [Agrobacterium]MBN7808898.1 ABC transporter permease [Agrobacterium rosae]NTE90188.1 ABC transporter permease [Agrobacterium rubi]NTF06007.1 ABC transporter permease [Agrobacterium rubi]NTF40246.1 ABC transporter permease [Agrobacterium rubi]OCJ53037.1 ABC transporter permease [Agrobacterium rubi]
MKQLGKLGGLVPWIALVVLILVVGSFDSAFLRPATLIGLFSDSATLFLMAIGMTAVIYIGSIDLSLQSIAAISSIVLALLIPDYGMLAIPAALLVGILFGGVSGVVHAVLRLPSFIATLAVGGVVTTAALYLSDQRSIQIDAQPRLDSLSWAIGTTFGVPNEVWVSLAVLAVTLTVEQATPFGKEMKAVGCGEAAARVAGINNQKIKIIVFMIAGLFAALSGVVLAGRLSSGSPIIANEFLLPAIAAVVLGGTSLTGGSGGVLRTLVGTLLIAVVRTGMTFVGINVLAQQIVFGIILVAAVALSTGRAPKGVMK